MADPKLLNQELWDILCANEVPCQAASTQWLDRHSVSLDVLRTDLLHPLISGNKWYKQKGHFQHALAHGYTQVLSFGGAWSNHIHALAASCLGFGIPAIGVIRGERSPTLTPTLIDAEAMGMRLHFVNRKDYRNKTSADFKKQLLSDLALSEEEVWIVPEGGSGGLGVKGCEEILAAGGVDAEQYQQIWLAAGTGATAAGIIRSVPETVAVHVVAALKGAQDWMPAAIAQHLSDGRKGWVIESDGHCGGFAKTTPELLGFMDDFTQQTGIPLDPVYTGKTIFAVYNAVVSGKIPAGSRVLAIHTGGLQGGCSHQPTLQTLSES